jgi:hypothetical protein
VTDRTDAEESEVESPLDDPFVVLLILVVVAILLSKIVSAIAYLL